MVFFSGPYFPVFGLNSGKYRPEKTPYLNTFHAVTVISIHSSLEVYLYLRQSNTLILRDSRVIILGALERKASTYPFKIGKCLKALMKVFRQKFGVMLQFFFRYCFLKNSLTSLAIWACLIRSTKVAVFSLGKILMLIWIQEVYFIASIHNMHSFLPMNQGLEFCQIRSLH